MKEKIVALASPHHDPSGKLLKDEKTAVKILKNIFDTANVSLSHLTDKRVRALLKDSGFHTTTRQEDGNISSRYTGALQLALEDSVDYIMLIDFDRAIHWALHYEDELSTVVEDLRTSEGFTSYVRSSRAFETHPLTQRQTEIVINQIASTVVGQQVDIVSGAYGMDRETAALVSKKGNKEDFSFYGQILALPFHEGVKINRLEVEGLEWETPDQFREEINKVGYIQWLHNFESLEEWEKRLTLAFEAGSAIQK